jgi:hypothetical protein
MAETENADLFPICVVEEDLSIRDLSFAEKSRDMGKLSREGTRCVSAREDDIPGCIIEETPWPGDLQVTEAKKNVNAVIEVVQRELVVGIGEASKRKTAPPSGLGGGMHGSLLSNEHLTLVFELRGHMLDLEHRALLMGQRMDLLLDAFSGAPAQRKCPLCAQDFVIPTGTTWQTGGGDTSPGA